MTHLKTQVVGNVLVAAERLIAPNNNLTSPGEPQNPVFRPRAMLARQRVNTAKLARGTFTIKNQGALTAQFAMAGAVLSGGIAMTDENEACKSPMDSCGQAISLYSIVRIAEVPSYLFEALSHGNQAELELALRIKNLENAYGLVVPPDGAPDINWHSRDLSYVHLCCKGIDYGRLLGAPAVWTFNQHFPSQCLQVIPCNLFIHNMFCESPFLGQNAAIVGGEHRTSTQVRFKFIESVLHADHADLVMDHEEAMNRFLEKRQNR
ncbi:MAG: hypothetical protein ABL908_13155 [Hyphomicrobium sp.]